MKYIRCFKIIVREKNKVLKEDMGIFGRGCIVVILYKGNLIEVVFEYRFENKGVSSVKIWGKSCLVRGNS